MSNPADSSQVVQQIRQALESLQKDVLSAAAAQHTEVLVRNSDLRSNFAESQWPALLSAYDGIVEVFNQLWAAKTDADLKNGTKPPALTCSRLLNTIANLCDTSSDFCDEVLKKQVVQQVLKDLLPLECDSADADLMIGYLCLLNNVANGSNDASGTIRQAGGVEIIQRLMNSKSQTFKIAIVFLASLVLNGEEKEALSTILSRDNVSFILFVLRSALRNENHISSNDDIRYTALEILVAISNVANFSQQFVSTLLQLNFLNVLIAVLKVPHCNASKEVAVSGPKAVPSYSTIDEKTAAARCLWSFAFYADSREAMKQNVELVNVLRSLRGEKEQKLKQAVDGIIWQLEHSAASKPSDRLESIRPMHRKAAGRDAASKPNENQPSASNRKVGHVMISYSWATQKTAVRISQALKSQKFAVWIDVDEMHGSTVEAMANAIDEAALILLCFSEKYFRSANCRAEAEYAFQLGKPIIPVRMHNYKATGWLGLILGAKLWYDFSDDSQFDTIMSKLLVETKNMLKQAASMNADATLAAANTAATSITGAGATADLGKVPVPSSPNVIEDLTIEGWSPADVQSWLQQNGFHPDESRKFAAINGVRLIEIVRMDSHAPDFLYRQLKKDFGIGFCTLLDFLHLLRKLRLRNTSA